MDCTHSRYTRAVSTRLSHAQSVAKVLRKADYQKRYWLTDEVALSKKIVRSCLVDRRTFESIVEVLGSSNGLTPPALSLITRLAIALLGMVAIGFLTSAHAQAAYCVNGTNSGIVGAAVVDGVACGSGATANYVGDVAVGAHAMTYNNGDVAVGYFVTAGVSGSTSVRNDTAFGTQAVATGSYSTAVGWSAFATSFSAIALGSQTLAEGANSLAIVDGAYARSTNDIAIGYEAAAVNVGDTTLGASATTGVPGSTTASQDTAIGASAKAIGGLSTAVGSGSSAASTGSLALGSGAVAVNAGDVALGQNSTTVTAVATPSTTINGITYTFAGINPTSTISVGALGSERTITNVAAGQISSASTDAINGSELYATNQAVSQLYVDISKIPAGQGGNGGTSANAVTYDNASRNSVTLGGASAATSVAIHNVAAGTSSTDAVNVSQLTSATSQAVQAADTFTDLQSQESVATSENYTNAVVSGLSDQFSALNQRINDVAVREQRDCSMGAAMNQMAMAGGGAGEGGRFAAGVGVCSGGDGAVSVGFATPIGERVHVSFGMASSGGVAQVGAGVAWDLH
jgi:trimeric autotransporter adhesin